MEEGDFPFKHERGRKFNVQSSNTLRAHPWVRRPDIVHVSTYPERPTTFCRGDSLSLDKQKRWEQLEEEQWRLSGHHSDDPNTHIVEKFYWPARTFVVINGKNINQSGKMSAPSVDDPVTTENPSKTVSRKARKREQQRKIAQQEYASAALEPKEGQVCWNVERYKPDMKKIHENQFRIEKWGKVDSKSRRLERKKDIKNIF